MPDLHHDHADPSCWEALHQDFGTVDGYFAWLVREGPSFSADRAASALTILGVVLAAAGPVWRDRAVYYHDCGKGIGVGRLPRVDPTGWRRAHEVAYPVEAVRAFLDRYRFWDWLQRQISRPN